MRKRIISFMCVVMALSTLLWGKTITVSAQETEGKLVDGSYLTTGVSSDGHTESNPLLRGEHLMDGNSGISKTGIGKIYAYGATSANHEVDFIAVIVYVDQYNEEDEVWEQVATWTAEDTNTVYISTAKSFKVPRGYYYRVRCEHFAGNEGDYPYDSDISFTNGIYVD